MNLARPYRVGNARGYKFALFILALGTFWVDQGCGGKESDAKQPQSQVYVYLTPIPASNLSADIEMDGVIIASVDRSSYTIISPPPGKHIFRVTLEGYMPVQKEVLVLDRGDQKLNFTLRDQ